MEYVTANLGMNLEIWVGNRWRKISYYTIYTLNVTCIYIKYRQVNKFEGQYRSLDLQSEGTKHLKNYRVETDETGEMH